MTLKQLSKEVQKYVTEGIAKLIIWKKGRSWNYETSWYDEGLWPSQEEAAEYEALIEGIKAVDEDYIELHTYECFARDTQDYIAFQIKRLYEGYKADKVEEFADEEISREIDESVDIDIKLSDEEALFLGKFAMNHYENSPENLGTRRPIFLVQSQTKRIVDCSREEPDEVKFIINDWCESNEFDSLEEIVKEFYRDKKCPVKIMSFNDAYESNDFVNAEGEDIWIFEKDDYLRAYGIDLSVDEVGYCYEYKTVAYFLIKEEAEAYIKYQRHNLQKPIIYATGCGYANKGEYDCFYDLLMKLGKMINKSYIEPK